jgi:protein tyrosine phosphatase (PTP) superfamily phosphohydrolase (DUF442 family)
MRFRLLLLTLAASSLLLAGCRNRMHRQAPPPACPPASTIPPQGIPDGAPPIPRGASPDNRGAELLLPQDPPGRSRSDYPRAVPPERRGAILLEPDYVERPKEPDADPPATDPPPAARKQPPADTPTGIAEFASVKDGVSAGLRPEIDGLDWLQAKGYKSIVYLRRPADDDTTDRRQVERREMKYISLEVSPEKLTQDWLDEFNRLIADNASRPIFVYGEPSVAGTVWYLHLRTAEFLTHDEARLRAGRIGRVDESSDLFKAAMKLLPPKS